MAEFARWADKALRLDMMTYSADDPSLEYDMLDSTLFHAHPCAAGAQKKAEGGRIVLSTVVIVTGLQLNFTPLLIV